MLRAIRNILEGKEKIPESKRDNRVAVSALMIEAAMMDGELTDDEKYTILQLLCNYFDLTDDESKALFKEASNLQSSSSQLIHFTRAIKDGYSEEEGLRELKTGQANFRVSSSLEARTSSEQSVGPFSRIGRGTDPIHGM